MLLLLLLLLPSPRCCCCVAVSCCCFCYWPFVCPLPFEATHNAFRLFNPTKVKLAVCQTHSTRLSLTYPSLCLKRVHCHWLKGEPPTPLRTRCCQRATPMLINNRININNKGRFRNIYRATLATARGMQRNYSSKQLIRRRRFSLLLSSPASPLRIPLPFAIHYKGASSLLCDKLGTQFEC